MSVTLERIGPLALEVSGPEGAPLVVCLHGFPDVPATWRGLREALVGAGLRVATPWLRGYAPSSLEGPFDLDTAARDVVRVVDALSPGRPAALVGHDWGAACTVVATARAPWAFSAAVTLALPHPLAFVHNLASHPMQLRRSAYMALFQLPSWPERALVARDGALVRRLWRAWSPGFEPPREHLDEVVRCLRASLPGPLGWYRALPGQLLAPGPARVETPTLALHGARDGCVHPGLACGQSAWFAGPFEQEVVPAAGHFLHLEQPALVHARVLAWLGEHPAPAGSAQRAAGTAAGG